eukprot:10525112-Lingulodinium_polyedra.AAC.1
MLALDWFGSQMQALAEKATLPESQPRPLSLGAVGTAGGSGRRRCGRGIAPAPSRAFLDAYDGAVESEDASDDEGC